MLPSGLEAGDIIFVRYGTMKLQCKELQAETDRFKVGRAYDAQRRGPDYFGITDDNGRHWLMSSRNLKVNINGESEDEARYALFRRSHA